MMTKDLGKAGRLGNWRAAMASGGDAIAHYWLTAQAYNEGRTSGASFDAALSAMDEREPATCHDFLRKFLAMYIDGGTPNEHRQAALVEAAQRILGGGSVTMADIDERVSASTLSLDLIHDLARRTQVKAEQIDHLMGVCEEAINETVVGSESTRADKHVWGRVLSFVDLAQSLARETADDGEAIEKIGASIRTAAA